MGDYIDLWTPVKIEQGICYQWKSGTFSLYVKRNGEEWFLFSEATAEADDTESTAGTKLAAEPKDIGWERWIDRKSDGFLSLKPLMPDRPVVVRPEIPMHIPKGESASFFISIPLWFKIVSGEKDEKILCEKPGAMLSNTWFGDPTQGELCYSLSTRLKRSIAECEIRPYRALCPVVLENNHSETLDFERLCIRADHLSLYEGEKQLVTNEVKVSYQGGEKLSKLKYGKKQPMVAGAGKIIADPRKPEENLIKHSFSNFITQAFYG